MTYQPPTTRDRIAALGDWSENTASMLLDLVIETLPETWDCHSSDPGITRHDVIAGIKAVIDGGEHEFGDEFEARVWEALGYTPDPFNRPCDYDLP